MLNIDLQGHHSNCPVWYKAGKSNAVCVIIIPIRFLKNTYRVQIFFINMGNFIYSYEGVIHGTKMMT